MERESRSTPHLERIERSQQLIVNGKPFLMLGAELQNSSMSSVAYMDPICKFHVWEVVIENLEYTQKTSVLHSSIFYYKSYRVTKVLVPSYV